MSDALSRCRLYVFDLDGTLYLGDSVLDGAHEIIQYLSRTGRQYIYLTNNSSRAASDYVHRLISMGFLCERNNVLTSGMATAEYLNENYSGKKIHLVGTEALKKELLDYGVSLSDEDAQVVCVGFDRELNYEKLEKAVHFLRRGAAFVAANPDLVCPMPQNEVLPDCGSICALLTASTGKKPFYVGKPNPQMLIMLSNKLSIPMEQIAVVGDRLYTDIAIGENAGAQSVCVLSGETNREMIFSSPVKPKFIFESVAELQSHLMAQDALI